MGPITRELHGREKRKRIKVGKPTLTQGTTNHEPGMLDNKFAFPSHCEVILSRCFGHNKDRMKWPCSSYTLRRLSEAGANGG